MPSTSHIVCVLDPYSTGGSLSLELYKRGGCKLIALWTDDAGDNRHHVPAETAELIAAGLLYETELTQDGSTIEALAETLRTFNVTAVICGGETGVKVADALGEVMGLRGNGTADGMEDRRDKAVQQEAVRATGMRACRESWGQSWDEVAAFCEKEILNGKLVVKPVESAGSDGVKLCESLEEAEAHFDLLMHSQRKAGASDNASVLCQEFLKGTEYVVDHVTRDGIHKTTMVWQYDKREANNSAFVYYDMLPVPIDSELAHSLISYTRGCIDAIKITNGATHSEIMMTADGPCLVEVNCRCHGGNGAWLPLASRLTGGVTQVSALADAFIDADAFKRLPELPPSPFLAGGCNPMFVSHREGRVVSRPGYERIRALRSFVSLDEAIVLGQDLELTVDLFTSAGQCILVHDDPAVVAADVATIRAMEIDGSIFELKTATQAKSDALKIKTNDCSNEMGPESPVSTLIELSESSFAAATA